MMIMSEEFYQQSEFKQMLHILLSQENRSKPFVFFFSEENLSEINFPLRELNSMFIQE